MQLHIGGAMNHQFIIKTIHERRVGIDLIAMPYRLETHYAAPDADQEGEGVTESGGLEIRID